MDIISLNLNNINLDNINFYDNDPETIHHFRLMASRNGVNNTKHLKKI